MHLPLSAALVPRLETLDHTGSTNDDLRRLATGPEEASWPDLSVLVTDDQRAGRGRLGRHWSAPPGTGLAVSVLLRPVRADGEPLPVQSYGWLPLLAGLAMSGAVRRLGADARVKWPNDVLIGGRKVCGVLSELLPVAGRAAPRPAGAVVGAGINLALQQGDLPVETATSLLLAGIPEPDPDAVLAAYLTELARLYRGFLATGGDATAGAPSLRDAVRAGCETIGRAVRIQLPAGAVLVGTAVDIDATGRLVVEANGRRTAVSAGDVTHLRY